MTKCEASPVEPHPASSAYERADRRRAAAAGPPPNNPPPPPPQDNPARAGVEGRARRGGVVFPFRQSPGVPNPSRAHRRPPRAPPAGRGGAPPPPPHPLSGQRQGHVA